MSGLVRRGQVNAGVRGRVRSRAVVRGRLSAVDAQVTGVRIIGPVVSRLTSPSRRRWNRGGGLCGLHWRNFEFVISLVESGCKMNSLLFA